MVVRTLVYMVSPRTARTIERNPVSTQQQKSGKMRVVWHEQRRGLKDHCIMFEMSSFKNTRAEEQARGENSS